MCQKESFFKDDGAHKVEKNFPHEFNWLFNVSYDNKTIYNAFYKHTIKIHKLCQ